MQAADHKTRFQGGSLQDCEIQGATLQNALFEGVAMFDADFSNSDLSGCEFYLVLAMGACFSGAKLEDVKFSGGSYQGVDFGNADLSGAIFCADNMGGEVDLSGANFLGAKLDKTLFEAALYDDSTEFPTGFSIQNKGLRLKEA